MRLLGMIPIMLVTQLQASNINCDKLEDSAYSMAEKAMDTNSCVLLEQVLSLLLVHSENCKPDLKAVKVVHEVYAKGCNLVSLNSPK